MSVPRPDTSSIPDAPGAYLFRDGDGRVVYVGKARSLRKRLASYWGKPLHARTEAMMEAAQSVEWMLASGEVDALMLEYNLIQRYLPRFNIRYRDDKSYPYLALTVGETWPRAQVMRGAKRKNVRYFGPFGHAWAIRDTLDALTRVFPVRTCTNSFFDSRARAQRPCLYYDIGRCSGPVRALGHRGHRGVLPGRRRRARRLPERQHASPSSRAWTPRCGRRPSARSTSRPPSCATSSPPRAAPWRPRRWCSPSPRTST